MFIINIFEAIILGIVQGFSEFLPISSTGHLTLLQKLFGFKEASLTLDIILHLGSLIPVLIIYRKDFINLLKNPFQKMTALLIIGTIPGFLFALLFSDFFDTFFTSTVSLAVGFFITGVLLLITDYKKDTIGKKKITPLDSLLIGTMQAIAIVPAISRSGGTISGALLLGIDRKMAAKFSFMLSVPAILGSAVFEIIKIIKGDVILSDFPLIPTLAGFFCSMITGYIAIRFMIKLIQNKSLKIFAYYVFALSAFILILSFLGKL